MNTDDLTAKNAKSAEMLEKAAAYLQARLDVMRAWTRERAEKYVGWFAAHGGLIVVREAGVTAGVACVRPVSELRIKREKLRSDVPENYAWDDAGAVLWVEQLAANREEIFEAVVRLARETFPATKFAAGARAKYAGRVGVVPWEKVARVFSRRDAETQSFFN